MEYIIGPPSCELETWFCKLDKRERERKKALQRASKGRTRKSERYGRWREESVGVAIGRSWRLSVCCCREGKAIYETYAFNTTFLHIIIIIIVYMTRYKYYTTQPLFSKLTGPSSPTLLHVLWFFSSCQILRSVPKLGGTTVLATRHALLILFYYDLVICEFDICC